MLASEGAVGRLAEIPGDDPVLGELGLGRDPLRLRRAWPRGEGALVLEYTAGETVVAGCWPADGRRHATSAAGELVALLAPATDRALPGLQAVATLPEARVVAHRAGRRATVSVPGAFAKVLAPGRVGAAADAHRAAADGVRGVVIPQLLGADDEAGILMLAAVEGTALSRLLDCPGAEGGLAVVGAALRRFHLARGLVSRRQSHDGAAEARVLTGWLDRLAPHEPALHARCAAAARPLLESLAGLPRARAVLLHRDLHDKQVFVGPGDQVALIDLDTLTEGDPAVDLANLAGHLELRALQGGRDPSSVARLRAALLDGYDLAAADRARLQVFEDAVRLRLACVYAFRPRWPGIASALVALAERDRSAVGAG